MVTEIRKLDCQFGRHYYKEKQSKSTRTCLQGTRKIGCKAHVEIRSIVVYVDFHINKEEVLSLFPRKLKEKKKENLNRLHQSLAENENVRAVTRYHILLPEEEAPGAYLGGVLGVLEHPPQPQAQY